MLGPSLRRRAEKRERKRNRAVQHGRAKGHVEGSLDAGALNRFALLCFALLCLDMLFRRDTLTHRRSHRPVGTPTCTVAKEVSIPAIVLLYILSGEDDKARTIYNHYY